MEHLQENINNSWNMADNSIRRPFKCAPLHTHPLYESEYMDCDNSNKVLMPESILTILSGYENFEYPIIFKIKVQTRLTQCSSHVSYVITSIVDNEQVKSFVTAHPLNLYIHKTILQNTSTPKHL